jgi:ribonuclease PH
LCADLNYPEEASDSAVVPVAIHPTKGTVVSVAMFSRMPVDLFKRVLDLAIVGCQEINAAMSAYVRQRAATTIRARAL